MRICGFPVCLLTVSAWMLWRRAAAWKSNGAVMPHIFSVCMCLTRNKGQQWNKADRAASSFPVNKRGYRRSNSVCFCRYPLCVTGNFNIYYTLTGTFLADGFKISSAVFAQRADIIIRQLIAFIDESANLADKSFLPSVSGFGFTLFW